MGTTEPAVEVGSIGQYVAFEQEGNREEIIVLGDDEASTTNQDMGEHLFGLSVESLRDLINQVGFEQYQKVKKFRRMHLVFKEKTEGKINNARKELRKKEAIKRSVEGNS